MNQIPKFRAWHIKEKRMLDITLIDYIEKIIWVTRIEGDEQYSYDYNFSEITPLQESPIPDIFEGDIMEITIIVDDNFSYKAIIEVHQNESGVWYFVDSEGRETEMGKHPAMIYHKLGNIYENLELRVMK